jgi:peptidoglycan/xylan/chitin deacetylase (PgdA/CDA1 family)
MTTLHGASLLPSIDRVLDPAHLPRIAVLTCDIEQDYGNRTGTCELLQTREPLRLYLDWCDTQNLPLSAFVVTSLLEKFPHLRELRERADVHAHAHIHDMPAYPVHTREEILRSQEAFTSFFGSPSLGYRAPQGIVMPGDDDVLKDAGFRFDSSLFPARRPGLFDYRILPSLPWIWKSGVMEFPFATVRGRMVTVSYLKMLGPVLWRHLLSRSALPPVLVIDSHLHDFFPVQSITRLPLHMRLLYRRHRTEGFALLQWLIETLREKEYTFVSLTSLFQTLSQP